MTGPRVRATAVLLFVFATGGLTGMLVDRQALGRTSAARAPAPASHQATMAEFRKVLDLDDAQVSAIDGVFARHQRVVQRAWEQLRPEVQEAMFQVHHEVMNLLRPDQQEHFQTWLRQQHEPQPPVRH
jgi:hypothetical protein